MTACHILGRAGRICAVAAVLSSIPMNDEQLMQRYLEAATARALQLGALLGLVAGFVLGVLFWP